MIGNLLKKLFARLSSPLPLREGLGMGLFLFVGSANIMAEGDPFGDYYPSSFPNTMIMIGCVYLDGQELGEEAVVAAYCGTTLRGKNSPDNAGNLYLTIGGNTSGDQLHFKVFTGGRVIEVDQGLIYTNDATIGSMDEPYKINLPAPVVTTPNAEGWATTCLPFDAEVPEDVEVWNVTAIENQELVMSQVTEGTILPANTPVLLKSEWQTSYEWLSKVVDTETLEQQSIPGQSSPASSLSIINVQSSILKGTTEPTPVADNSVLTLGYSNDGSRELGFWLFTGTTLNANCAYIADFPSGLRGVTFPFEGTTAISHQPSLPSLPSLPSRPTVHPSGNSHCYDLQGRRVVPTHGQSPSLWKKGRQGQPVSLSTP